MLKPAQINLCLLYFSQQHITMKAKLEKVYLWGHQYQTEELLANIKEEIL